MVRWGGFMVRGSRFMIRGGRFMARGGGFMVKGGGFVIKGGENSHLLRSGLLGDDQQLRDELVQVVDDLLPGLVHTDLYEPKTRGQPQYGALHVWSYDAVR
jgi:hypothetical protein